MTRLFQIIAAGIVAVAAPAGSVRHVTPPPKSHAAVAAGEPVPGIVLIGMGITGLAIVGVSARRRQPGRSVTN